MDCRLAVGGGAIGIKADLQLTPDFGKWVVTQFEIWS